MEGRRPRHSHPEASQDGIRKAAMRPTAKRYFAKLFTASASELETSKTVSRRVICNSSLVLDPRLQSRSAAPPDFALECAATSAPRPELSIIVTFFRSR